ncbi:MAG: fatty-acid oxidation protein subunit alpha [Symploca sp. SIO1A3]|nr:fatty-acid oxidation protein subunit alpha [Symploca sp. SIO1A3]
MPAKDLFHHAVRHALEKEDWIVTHDPLHIELPDIEVYIDLGANRLLAAETENLKIAIEIKTFLGTSTLFEFHTAVGQFVNYRFLLNKVEPDRKLYLAVPVETYNTFFRRETVQEMIQAHRLKIVVYDPDLEVLKQWIE